VAKSLKNIDQWVVQAQASGFNAETFARLCGITTRQLRRHVRRTFGRSAQDWLDEQRMIAAGHRLKETPCVKTVAADLGFKQASHFSRKFKEHYGLPPTEFIATSVNLKNFLKSARFMAEGFSE
jgi:transcriptional regulator GlxA family with amidase domain